MGTKLLNIKYLLGMVILTLGLGAALAENTDRPIRPPPVWPPPANFLLPSHLGTSKLVMQQWSRDLEDLVNAAMPGYDDGRLWLALQKIKLSIAGASPGAELKPAALSQLFLFNVKEGQGQSEKGAYRVDPLKGEALIVRDLFDTVLSSERRAKQLMKEIHTQHLEVLARLGIGVDQIYALNLHFRNMEIGRNLGQGKILSVDVPMVEGFVTYVTRGVGGIIVEGSEIKILSQDEKALAGLTLRWPPFLLHPELRDMALRDKLSLEREVIAKARRKLAEGQQYNVKMAVVFRPALYLDQTYFVPALKVGVYSRPASGDRADANGAAGEKFYVSLLKQVLPEEITDRVDAAE